jgi:hypothetical protein
MNPLLRECLNLFWSSQQSREAVEAHLRNWRDDQGRALVDADVKECVDVVASIDGRYHQYKDYLQAIFKPGDTVCFVGIEHNVDGDKTKERVTQTFTSLEDALTLDSFDVLDKLNNEASTVPGNTMSSVYVAMNSYPASLIGKDEGRTQENVVAVRALQADLDDINTAAAKIGMMQANSKVPPPALVVESSPGKFQGIWPVDDVSKDEAKPLMQAIATTFGTDPAVAETARVMRVPGFVNHKPKYLDEPFAKLVENTGRRYTRSSFKLDVARVQEFTKKPEGWLEKPFIHGDLHNQIIAHAGHYIQNENIKNPDILHKLITLSMSGNTFELDGKTPFEWNDAVVRQLCVAAATSWKTGEEKREAGKILMNMKPDALPGAPAIIDPTKWREEFRTVGEMEDRPIDEIIKGALQEGVTFIGANPGDGKTLVSLAFAKAICTGTPLFGLSQFAVPKPRTVIYLIPETRDPAFRRRCEAFQIPDNDMFLARTVSAGPSLALTHPSLMQAVKDTKAVVFLDTAARFMTTSDENSAAQNRQLVDDVIALQAAGAVAVVLDHHVTKAAQSEGAVMTLENMLRGTGDFAAMCDQVYGIRKDRLAWANGAGPMEIELVALKDREQIGSLTRLKLAASRTTNDAIFKTVSIINETGNFRVIEGAEVKQRLIDKLIQIVTNDPEIKLADIADMLGHTVKEYTIKNELNKEGYHTTRGGKGGSSPWHKDEPDKPCQYERAAKPIVAPKQPPKEAKKARTIDDVIAFLNEQLEGTNAVEEDSVYESTVLLEAARQGISKSKLNEAKAILGVVIVKYDGGEKGWALPANAAAAATVN